MATIRISKIKARRGSNEQRKQVVFDQGELVYVTDTQRFYVGDGVTIGGGVIGMKMHNPLSNYAQLSSLVAERGDVVKANNSYYLLTAVDYTNINSWSIIQLKVDPTFFKYNSSDSLTLNTDSVSASYIKSTTVLSGIKIENGILQSNFNTKSLEISSNQLSLKVGGINEREINSSSFGNGISGGSNLKIGLKVDGSKFQFDSGTLKLSSLPTTFSNGLNYNPTTSVLTLTANSNFGFTGNGVLALTSLPSSFFGNGLNYNPTTSVLTLTANSNFGFTGNGVLALTSLPSSFFGGGLNYNTTTSVLSTTVTGVTGALSSSSTGVISIKSDGASGTNQWAKLTVDQYGRVTSNTSSIYGVLTGSSGSSTHNNNNTLSALFNGTPAHTLSGAIPGMQLTKFSGISSNGVTSVVITLSSAGFITFEGNTTTRTGQSVGRFAIPIFAY